MKKLYFLLSIIFISTSVSTAQSIDIVNNAGVSVVGDTITFNHVVDPNDQFQYFENKGFVDIINTSNSIITMGLIRHEAQIVQNTYDYLCWGSQCFGERQAGTTPVWDVNDSVTVSPNDTASGLLGGLVIYHRPNGIVGESIYEYEVYDRANRNSSASIFVKISASFTTSLSDDMNNELKLNVFPNPIGNMLNLDLGDSYNLENSNLVLYNIVGERVFETQLEKGKTMQNISTSALQSGMYFLSIEKNGNRLLTKRVIKK
jgi:hypothetical protein